MQYKRRKQPSTNLLLEAQALLEGVVQLRVGVAELLAAHEALEPLAQPGPRAVPLGEGGHHLRVADYKQVRLRIRKDKIHVPMKDGEMQSGSMNSPTS